MEQTTGDYTTDELICVCIARQIEDGEAVAQGIATPLVAAGYINIQYPIPNIQIETRRFQNDNAEVNFGRPGNYELG